MGVFTLWIEMKAMKCILGLLLAGAQLQAVAQGSLLVSEVLFQPRSGEAEYVELYNGSSNMLELSDFMIVRWVGDSLGTRYALPQHVVAPHDYVVLTKDAASVAANYTVKYPGKLLECNLPTYPNDGGSVVLATAEGTVVEKFDYRPSMHSRLLRNKAGVALERRSFDVDCNAEGNWFSASSTAGYGTPTCENSQSREWLVEESSFGFSSTLLSPDGDGYQDELVIEYRMENDDVYGQIAIYDARGSRVGRLLNDGLMGTHGVLVWDGRGDGGAELPSGRYVLYINLYDLQGTKQVIKRTISIVY